jgi:hypothetical protein
LAGAYRQNKGAESEGSQVLKNKQSKSSEIKISKEIRDELDNAPAFRHMPYWTKEETNILKEYYGKVSTMHIAKALKRTRQSVVSKAMNMRALGEL